MPQYARDEAGNVWEVDAQGNAVRLAQPASGPGPVTIGRPDPAKAAIQRKTTLDNAVTEATLGDQIAKARADAVKAQAEAKKAQDELARGGLTPDQVSERRAKITQFNQLAAQINRVQELYNAGPGKTKGVAGLLDYIPSDANARFDAAGAALSQQGLAAFRVPGTGTVSDRDAIMFDRANLPTADTRDAAIEEQLAGLRRRVEEEYLSRGLPVPQWTGLEQQTDRRNTTPAAAMGGASGGNAPPPLTPWDQPSAGAVQAVTGQTKRVADPEAAAALNAMFRRGASFEELNAAAVALGGNAINPVEFAKRAEYAKRNPNYQPFTVTREVPTTARERISASDGAAFFGSLGNMAGAGIPEAISPEQFAMARENSPTASLLGGVAGSLVGTGAIGAVGRNTIGRGATNLAANMGDNAVSRALNRLTAQTTGGRFGRNLATDMTYGGIYGGATEGDPLTGALTGGVASVGGQTAGYLLGRTIGGLPQTAPAQYLRNRGIGLTTGQRMGGFAKALEDKAMSVPLVGDLIKNRRVDAFNDFNRAAINEAGVPISATTQNVGMQGVQDILDATGTAYDNAVAGVTVPLDNMFQQGLAAARAQARQLPPDLAPRAQMAINNRIGPIENAGQLTGETYQQGVRGLKGYKAETTKPGFEADYRDAIQKSIDVLTGQMKRGGGERVVQGLNNANAAYRNAKTLQKAVEAAKNGTASGDIQVFTPAQLNTASYQTASKFPGQRPFAELADAGQQVLPSQVPNSGTADRMLALMLPAGLGGASIGADQLGWDKAGGTLGLAALLAAGGTKTGQAALNKVLFDRPAPASAFGALIRKHKGLFGSAAVPLLLEAQK